MTFIQDLTWLEIIYIYMKCEFTFPKEMYAKYSRNSTVG